MTDASLKELAMRIRQELEEIHSVLLRMGEGWERARRSNDDYYLDGVALNLHGFYSGFERIFTHIAEIIEGDLPRGESWHVRLLQKMMTEIPKVRPAVISTKLGAKLDEYRGFRHVVRNVYTYNLDPTKLEKLIHDAPALFEDLKLEISAFADFLEME